MPDQASLSAPDLLRLTRENEELREQLREAEELITAVRTGAVDALAIQSSEGPRIFTLEGADHGYRTLIEQMNEGALLLSPEGVVLYCNAALAALLGSPLAELMGRRVAGFVPAAFQDYWAGLVARAWAGKARGELPLQSTDGRLHPSAVSMNVLTFGGALALAVLVTDLSAQREVAGIRALVVEQNALLEATSEELARQQAARRAVEQAAAETSRILEGIPQIAWASGSDGRNAYTNRRWFDFIGKSPRDPDRPPSSYVHPDDHAAVQAAWQHSLTAGQPFDIECRLRNAAGCYCWMLGRALPSRSEQGDIVQWIGTFTDIQEHKLDLVRIAEAQVLLRANNLQLTRANADLDNFVYAASHDLKQPVHNIEGLLTALLDELPAERSALQANILRMMGDSVERFKRTVEQLTDISRLAHEPTAAQPVPLATVVRDVCLDLEPQLHATDAQLTLDVDTCPPIVFLEKNLRSIVYNLLSNALKYRAPDRRSQVALRAHATPDGYLHLVVQDNGLGLDEVGQQRLFGMFQRLHSHVEGSGIGLFMVKKIAENAGGRVEVVSALGMGSTFTVVLPLLVLQA